MEHEHDLPTLPANTAPPQAQLASIIQNSPPAHANPNPNPGLNSPPRITRSPSPGRPTSSEIEKSAVTDDSEFPSAKESGRRVESGAVPRPPPAIPTTAHGDRPFSIRKSTLDDVNPRRSRTALDWIVPERPAMTRRHTVGERLAPTLNVARLEKDKYAAKAKLTGWAINGAIGLQVLLGALTTGLSAVTATVKQTRITTAILGGLATIVASYLARARGSNEPELSIVRVKDLEQFIRECETFEMDRGHLLGNEEDSTLEGFRRRFEELLGNANGERRMSPPV